MKSDVEMVLYNTSKKLAELDKHIQYLAAHLEDRMYQYEIELNDNFEKEKDFIQKYAEEISVYQNELDKYACEIRENISKIYQKKYDLLKMSYLERVNDARNEINKADERVRSVISDVNEQISKISGDIEDLSNCLLREFTETNHNTLEDTKNMDFNPRKELADVDTESKQKYKTLEDEHNKRIVEITQHFELEKRNLLKGIKSNNTFEYDLLKSFSTNLKHLCEEVSKEMTSAKQRVIEYKASLSLLMKSHKDKLDTILNTFDQGDLKLIKERNEILESLKKQSNAIDDEKNLKIEALSNFKRKIQSEREFFRDQLHATIDSNKKAIKELEAKPQGYHKQEDDSLNDHKERLSSEIAQLDIKYGEEQAIISKRLEQMTEDILKNSDQNFEELRMLREEYQQYKTDNAAMYIDIEINFKEYLYVVLYMNKLTIRSMNEKIKHENELVQQYYRLIKEKRKLIPQLNDQYRTHKTALENIRLSEESEFDFIKQYNDKMHRDYNDEYAKKGNEVQNLLNERAKDLYAKFEQEKLRVDREYTERFKTIKESLCQQYDSEKEIKVAQRTYDDLVSISKSLNVIENLYGDLEDPQKLREELECVKKKIVSTRSYMITQFKLEEKNEKDRHHKALLDINTNTLDPGKIDEKLSEIRKSKQPEITRLNDEINRLSEKYGGLRPISHLNEEVTDSDEVVAIRGELNNLKEISNRQIKNAEDKMNNELKCRRAEIDSTYREIIERRMRERKAQDDGLKKYSKLFEREYSRRKENAINNARREEELIASYRQVKANILKKHNKNVEYMKEEIKKVGGDIAKEISEIKFMISDTIVKNRRLKEEYKKSFNEELNELRSKINKDPLLDPDIQAATQRLIKAEKDFSNKPMRAEEFEAIKALSDTLDQKSKYLCFIGRDLLAFRERVIEQEEELNLRFGVQPSITSFSTKSVNVRSMATANKKLPRLSATNLVN